ncbi:MAG TPA: hypothetical protein VM597_15140 [Gemmataceae bacterium]|nr:hypothetical protein [Gemmataceae bacterium]
MGGDNELRMIVEDLIQVLHQQAVELERLTDHLAQTVGRLPEGPELSVVRSELTGLHVRAKKLTAAALAKA